MIGMWKLAPALAVRLHRGAQAGGTHFAHRFEDRRACTGRRSPPECSMSCRATAKRRAWRWSTTRMSTRLPSPALPPWAAKILRGAAGNFKRVTLELGGKSANIIFPDADIDRRRRPPLRHLLQQRTGLLGGFADLRARIGLRCGGRTARGRARAIRLGDPMDPSTSMGPLVSDGKCIESSTISTRPGPGRSNRRRRIAGGETGFFSSPRCSQT